MKSLDERLSSTLSPYDEADDITNGELMTMQYFLYEKESILNSIGKDNSKIIFDLNLESVLEQLPTGSSYRSFVNDCMIKLSEEYHLDPLLDYIKRKELINSTPDLVMDLVKYITCHKWLDDIAPCLPEFDMNILNNIEVIRKIITESFFTTRNKILEIVDIHPLIHFYFTFCSVDGGTNTLIKMVMSDLPGIISIQLVKKMLK
jgi:hypothetical protein